MSQAQHFPLARNAHEYWDRGRFPRPFALPRREITPVKALPRPADNSLSCFLCAARLHRIILIQLP